MKNTKATLTGIVALILFAGGNGSTAQEAPNAGQSIREIERIPLQLPARDKLDLDLPPAPTREAPSAGPRLEVKGFTISGNQAIADEVLLGLIEDYVGRELDLNRLQQAAQRLSAYYRQQGYPVAGAYLPAQEVEQGIVEIAVLEGRIGEVRVNNHLGMRDSVLGAPLGDLDSGEVVRADSLEQGLLLLSDLPGVNVRARLRPGTSLGTTDLVVDVREAARVDGAVTLDNYGNRGTGKARLSGRVAWANPLRLGDSLSVRLLGSNEEQYYHQAGYQLPVGPWSSLLGVSHSRLGYQLAGEFADLGAEGTATVTSIFARQPLIRSRALNLYARLRFDDKQLEDKFTALATDSDKDSRVWVASLAGDSRDGWAGGGRTSFALTYNHGDLDLHDRLDAYFDRRTANIQGKFAKMELSVVRLQRLPGGFSLYTRLQGQWADGNLDASEKLGLGGAYGVRAYPQGEANGDQGWLGRVELRRYLSPALQLSTFVDHGQVRHHKKPWDDGENHRDLSGAGLGVHWNAAGWEVDASAAWDFGSEAPRTGEDRSPRVWARITRLF